MTKDDNAGGSSASRRRRRRRSSRGRGRAKGQQPGGKASENKRANHGNANNSSRGDVANNDVKNNAAETADNKPSGDSKPDSRGARSSANGADKRQRKSQHAHRGGNSRGRNSSSQGRNPRGRSSRGRNSQRGDAQRKSSSRSSSHNNSQHNSQRRKSNGPNKRRSNGSHLEHSDLPLSVETSAGGLVLSGLAEAVQGNNYVDLSKIYVALIGRLDRRGRLLWSMPKGHIENDESKHATAEREVWEETGIAGEVLADLGTIDYWFVSDGTRIHKTVHHHLLRFIDGDLNDEDPEVTEVSWVPVNQLVERLAYADERRLARHAFDTLPIFARKEAEAGRLTPR